MGSGAARARGDLGEDFACARLKEDGYLVLGRNYRVRGGEVDIIAQKGETIAFVEVKTRAADAYGTPAQAVTRAKRRRVALAAVSYLRERGIYNTGEYQPRFDIFEVVTTPGGSPKIERWAHLPAAYDTEGLDVFI